MDEELATAIAAVLCRVVDYHHARQSVANKHPDDARHTLQAAEAAVSAALVYVPDGN